MLYYPAPPEILLPFAARSPHAAPATQVV